MLANIPIEIVYHDYGEEVVGMVGAGPKAGGNELLIDFSPEV
jgi:hypothetical protein